QRICFEITETAAITSFNHAVEFLNRFKALGFRFALDDFGSGVSSFAYLHRLPIDLVKIDGIFVRELLADEMKQSIVTAIVQISAQAGLLTIAEFVEDDATLAWLRAAGVNYAQGNGVSMPFPLDELLA
ncbi:MAG TPA: EAL domain-containing protein, partial [Pseudomonadales bacterium]|nr:EAL domain-containing protein [Pseudomonadales bacterium]